MLSLFFIVLALCGAIGAYDALRRVTGDDWVTDSKLRDEAASCSIGCIVFLLLAAYASVA
jgi:hypothetical protein